jgi:uncharacterized protein
MTSHVDLPATLLPRLGVTNPPQDYSLGQDLLGPYDRRYTVIGDWASVGYVDTGFKAQFPTRSGSLWSGKFTTKDDAPVEDADAVMDDRSDELALMLQDLGRFFKR